MSIEHAVLEFEPTTFRCMSLLPLPLDNDLFEWAKNLSVNLASSLSRFVKLRLDLAAPAGRPPYLANLNTLASNYELVFASFIYLDVASMLACNSLTFGCCKKCRVVNWFCEANFRQFFSLSAMHKPSLFELTGGPRVIKPFLCRICKIRKLWSRILWAEQINSVTNSS